MEQGCQVLECNQECDMAAFRKQDEETWACAHPHTRRCIGTHARADTQMHIHKHIDMHKQCTDINMCILIPYSEEQTPLALHIYLSKSSTYFIKKKMKWVWMT